MKEIKNVAVIGAGAMGMQIGLNGAEKGFQVTVYDAFPEMLGKAEAWGQSYLGKSVELGKLTQKEYDEIFSRIAYEADLATAVKNADLVIEAIIEKFTIKEELFNNLENMAPQSAIIASNSSFLPSSQFAHCFKDPSRLANLHYFNPAMRMNLVEIIRGEHTGDDTIKSLESFSDAIGKEYILVNKEIDGFVVNRLLRAVQNEAFFLLNNGIASFEDIDKGAEKGLNYPMGPFRLMDFTGLDIAFHSRTDKFNETQDPTDAPPAELVKRYERGDYGRKSGTGWYDYNKK